MSLLLFFQSPAVTVQGGATLTGTGVLAPSGMAYARASATATGQGDTAAAGTSVQRGTATATGTGTMHVTLAGGPGRAMASRGRRHGGRGRRTRRRT